MVFPFWVGEMFFDVFKPMLLLCPVMEARKPVLLPNPVIQPIRAACKAEDGENEKRELRNKWQHQAD